MRFWTRSIVNLKEILVIKNLKKVLICLGFGLLLLLHSPLIAKASIKSTQGEDGISFSRRLESLRDLDYQTWQVVAYREDPAEANMVLRIVGYPGTLRIDHPTSLEVHAGLKDWSLKDITLLNPKLANDPREAAAEFELSPLINDLSNNRPLRFTLQDVFNDLPIPPYVVNEWRSLPKENLVNEKV